MNKGMSQLHFYVPKHIYAKFKALTVRQGTNVKMLLQKLMIQAIKEDEERGENKRNSN